MAEFIMNSVNSQPESLNQLTTIAETTHSNATNTTVHGNVHSGNKVYIGLAVLMPILLLHFVVILVAVYLWKKHKRSRVPDPENAGIFFINVGECSQYGNPQDDEALALTVPLMNLHRDKFWETQSSEDDDDKEEEEVYAPGKSSKENLLKQEEKEKKEKTPFAVMICDEYPEYALQNPHQPRRPYVESNKSDSDSEEK